MASRIRPRGGTATRLTLVNPVLADRELVVEKDTGKLKIGDGVTAWNLLPYASKGDQGVKGDKGDFVGITDLIGTSSTSLTIAEGVKQLVVTLNQSWTSGMFLQVSSRSNPDNYFIGQVFSYDKVSGAMTLNVTSHGCVGVGTFALWDITFALGAGVVYTHGGQHLPGGDDAIPDATSAVSGLFPARLFDRLDNLHTNAVYVQDTQPALNVGDVWFATSAQLQTAPVISAIYPQNTTLNTAKDIGLTLYDAYDSNSVYLTFSSSNTTFLPLSAISTSGSGGVRHIHIDSIGTAGESVLTATATNSFGASSSTTFLYKVVTTAKTVTATTKTVTINGTTDTFGDIAPSGAIVIPTGSSLHFDGVGDPGYAVSVMRVDGVDYAEADYTFSNIQADHTIEATFAPAYKITAGASLNGAVVPSGDVWVCAGQSKTFNFMPNTGFSALAYILDGVTYNDVSAGSVTISSIAANHNLIVTFSGLSYSVTKTAGANGTITGVTSAGYNDSPSFAFTPATDYEVADSNYVIAGSSIVATGSVTGITIPAPITGNITVTASFRIQAPAPVTGFTASDAGTGTGVILTWNTAARATTYSVYWSSNGADLTAAQIIARGNTPLTTGLLTVTQNGLTEGVTYRYCAIANNTTGSGTVSSVGTAVPTTNTLPTLTSFTWEKMPLH